MSALPAVRRLAALALASLLHVGVASAAFVPGLGAVGSGGLKSLTPGLAAALGAPSADRLGFVDLSGAAPGQPIAFGPVSAATLKAAAADPSEVLGVLNGDAVGGINYMGEAFDPFQAAFIDAGLLSLERAYALLFDSSAGPFVYGGAALFAGETASPFVPPAPVGPRNTTPTPDEGRQAPMARTPLPAGAALLVAALGGLGWAARRRRAA